MEPPSPFLSEAFDRQQDAQHILRLLRAFETDALITPPSAPPLHEYHEDTAPALPSDWEAGDEGREVEFKKLNAAEAPVRAIYKHVRVHGNAFLNADGGSLLFGISDAGRVCGISLGAKDRDVLRNGIDQIFMNFYPRVDPLLYNLTFRRVMPTPTSPSKAGTPYTPPSAERFVLLLQVRRGLAPLYFVSPACDEAYIRGSGSSMSASKSMIAQRLCFGKPPPLTFAGLSAPITAEPPPLLRAFAVEWDIIHSALSAKKTILAPPIIYVEGPFLSGKSSFVAKLTAELAPIYGEGLLEINDWRDHEEALSKWHRFEQQQLLVPPTPLTSAKGDSDQGRYDARLREAHETPADPKLPSQQSLPTSYYHARRFIIVLDNAPSAEAVRAIVHRRPRSSLVLITSRRRLALDVEFGALRITLGGWSTARLEEALHDVAPRTSAPLVAALASHALEQPALLLALAPLLTRCTDVSLLRSVASSFIRDILVRRFESLQSVVPIRMLLSLALFALPISALDAAHLWGVTPSLAALILHIWSDLYCGLLRPAPDKRVSLAPLIVAAAASAATVQEKDVVFIEGALRAKALLSPVAVRWALLLEKHSLAWLALCRCARP